MTLKEKIHDDLIAAMKAKEETRMQALRLLKAAIMKFEVSGDKKTEASDEDVLKLIAREAKQRKDSIEAFEKGARPDLALKEKEELGILQAYLPEQMSEEELKKIIEEVVQAIGAHSKTDMGKVIGAVMGRVKGKAEGQMVSRLVGGILK